MGWERNTGLKTGLYTSPHIIDVIPSALRFWAALFGFAAQSPLTHASIQVRERIRISGDPLTRQDFSRSPLAPCAVLLLGECVVVENERLAFGCRAVCLDAGSAEFRAPEEVGWRWRRG